MKVYVAKHTNLPSIVTDVVPAGSRYRVTGAGAGLEWLVDEGLGRGFQVAVSDPAAPVGVRVTYTVTVGATAVSGSVVRGLLDPLADTVVTSVDGRSAFESLWEGDAKSSLDPRASYGFPTATRFPHQVLQLAPAAPAWAFESHVEAVKVPAARRVFEAGRAWVVHSHARCTPECTLPEMMRAGVSGKVDEGSWPLGRTFSTAFQELEPVPSGVPVVTWGEAAGAVWGPSTSFESIRLAVSGG